MPQASQLKDFDEVTSCYKVKFMDHAGEKEKFKGHDIVTYQRGNERYVRKAYVRPIGFSSHIGFMKVIDDGKIKLCQFDYIVHRGGTMAAPGTMPASVKMASDFSERKTDYYIEKDG
ncbi:MAG: hypothetical protein HC896_16385 [Bacteroidales bacterium]|nr:hypothetical protein [Bacteroidales bacterium]